MKTILYWNDFHGILDYNFGFGTEGMVKYGCSRQDCYFTNNRTLFNESDVVIFSIQNTYSTDLPSHRFSHQRFVFYEMESPLHTRSLVYWLPEVRYDYFNWSMTYRLDSDIVHRDSYGMFKPINEARARLPEFRRGYKTQPPSSSIDLSQKTKMVGWVVSNCHATSQREKYVEQLRRFIDVDIHGKCGNLSLPSDGADFDDMIRQYKFYLAFENSLCPDYVTEKLIRSYAYDVVPIVYGGADYSQFAPPGSYIDIRDFPSPESLARYLNLLNDNDLLYSKYFEWKKDYQMVRDQKKGWCHLCNLAHDETQPPKTYHDMHSWWTDERPCDQPFFQFD